MSNHLENPHLAGTPARANGLSAYPSELIPQNIPWRPAPCPYPVEISAATNPGYVYEAQHIVCILLGFDHFVCLRAIAGPQRLHIQGQYYAIEPLEGAFGHPQASD